MLSSSHLSLQLCSPRGLPCTEVPSGHWDWVCNAAQSVSKSWPRMLLTRQRAGAPVLSASIGWSERVSTCKTTAVHRERWTHSVGHTFVQVTHVSFLAFHLSHLLLVVFGYSVCSEKLHSHRTVKTIPESIVFFAHAFEHARVWPQTCCFHPNWTTQPYNSMHRTLTYCRQVQSRRHSVSHCQWLPEQELSARRKTASLWKPRGLSSNAPATAGQSLHPISLSAVETSSTTGPRRVLEWAQWAQPGTGSRDHDLGVLVSESYPILIMCN